MKDQYGNAVPDDLVLLDCAVEQLDDAEIAAVDGLDWYELNGSFWRPILVGWSAFERALPGVDALGIDEYDIDLALGVSYIDAVLHRWNDEDGFYHA
jgi:hypothetical protein